MDQEPIFRETSAASGLPSTLRDELCAFFQLLPNWNALRTELSWT